VATPRRKETPGQRMQRDTVERAKRAPRWDAGGVYAQKAADLAARLGLQAAEIYDEHCERAAIRHYLGEADIHEAERLAWGDVEERFIKQGVLL
jgi:hypothetical protein